MKTIATFLVLFLGLIPNISSAKAKDGVYVGADLNLSNAKYQFRHPFQTAPQTRVSGTAAGLGASVGYRKEVGRFFVAPEGFYDYLNSSSHTYFSTTDGVSGDRLRISSRYGLKGNFGYDFTDKFSAYVTYGITRIHRASDYKSFDAKEQKWKSAPIYGIGAQYKICEKWAARAEFNTQKFSTTYYAVPEAMSDIRLNVWKLGAIYSF